MTRTVTKRGELLPCHRRQHRQARKLVLLLAILPCALPAQSHVSGQIVRREGPGYIPIAGARVEARLAGEDQVLQSATSGVMGRYLLANLPAAEVTITATHPRFYATRYYRGTTFRATNESFVSTTPAGAECSDCSPPHRVHCPPAGLCAQLDFEMQPAGELEVLVVDSLGEPVEGASVRIRRLDEPGRARRPAVRTARGVFRGAGMRPGQYQVEAEPVERRGIRYQRASAEFEFLHGQETETLRLVMPSERLYRISGRILGLTKANAPGMLVLLEPEPESEPSEQHPRLGALLEPDGHFAINGVPRGTFALKLVREQDARLDLRPTSARLITTIQIDADRKGLLLHAPPDLTSP